MLSSANTNALASLPYRGLDALRIAQLFAARADLCTPLAASPLLRGAQGAGKEVAQTCLHFLSLFIS